MKRAEPPKAAAPAPAADDANKKLKSAVLSDKAYRAVEFLPTQTNSAQPLTKLELAAVGLECHGNTAQTMGMSFAHSLIQHAVGYYGPLEESSEKLKHEVTQKIDGLIKEFTPVAGRTHCPEPRTILNEINKAFPHARLSVKVIDGDTGENGASLQDGNHGSSAKRHSNEILLFLKNDRFEAIAADSKKLAVSSAPECRSIVAPEYGQNISRAILAGTEIKSFLNLDNSKKRGKPSITAKDREEKTKDSVLNNALKPLNIERVPNDSPDEISLVTGLLRLATGINEKKDLPIHVRGIMNAEPLHALEARQILKQLDAHSEAKKYFEPAGIPDDDERVSQVIEVINRRYDVKLNVMLVEAHEDGLRQTGMYSAESNGNKLKPDHEDPSATTIVLLRNGNSFEPLRRSALKTNPFLQPAIRNEQKSLYGNVKAKTADIISLGRRNKVRKMSDDQLELHSPAHGARMQRAMEKELGKRQNGDRVDIGIQTLNERAKSWFRHVPLENNRYAEKSTEELNAKLNPANAKNTKSPRKQRLIKLALYQKMIAAHHPIAARSTPPVLKPLASEVKIEQVDMRFKRLIHKVNAETVNKTWVDNIYTPGATANKPWKDAELHDAEKLLIQAWTAARRGFTSGNSAYLEESNGYLGSAKTILDKAHINPGASIPVDKAFIEADKLIGKLSDNLHEIIADEPVDPSSAAFKAYKACEQRGLGLTPEAIAALGEIDALKSNAMDQQRALRFGLMKTLEDGEILRLLQKADATLTQDSPVQQVLKAYRSVSSRIETQLKTEESAFETYTWQNDSLTHIEAIIDWALRSDSSSEELAGLDLETLTSNLAGFLDQLQPQPPIDMTTAFAQPHRGILALPEDTLKRILELIEPTIEFAEEKRDSSEKNVKVWADRKDKINQALPDFDTKNREIKVMHSRIAALEKLEESYVKDREAAVIELQRQANVEVLKRVVHREAGLTHRDPSTT